MNLQAQLFWEFTAYQKALTTLEYPLLTWLTYLKGLNRIRMGYYNKKIHTLQ